MPIKQRSKAPVIGIIGGAGPDATIDLQYQLAKEMKKQLSPWNDQEHYRVIVDNYTTMPDRSLSLLNQGPSPINNIVTTAKNLVALGCNILVYPCNTAHTYIPAIEKYVNATIIDMIAATTLECNKAKYDLKRPGILCTDMTASLGLYKKHSQFMQNLIYPDAEAQQQVMHAIFTAKAGFTTTLVTNSIIKEKIQEYLVRNRANNSKKDYFNFTAAALLNRAIENMLQQGADGIIMGCTEIPLCINADETSLTYGIPCFNPTAILAAATVKYAKNMTRILVAAT